MQTTSKKTETLTNTIKTTMEEFNLCTPEVMLQRGSEEWAKTSKKLTMKFISIKLKEAEQTQ